MKKASRFLKASLLALMFASAVTAKDDYVRLRLNWMYYGSHVPLSLGLDTGYCENEGIDLDIRSGNGSSTVARLVANDDSDFADGSCAAMVMLALKGEPLISISIIDAMETQAAVVRPGTRVSSVADLKGKKILTPANAGVKSFFPLAEWLLIPRHISVRRKAA